MSTRNYTPQEWLEEITDGLEYRRRFGLEDKWGELEAIYYNVHESMMNDGPNILLSQGDAMLSTLTVPEARFGISPTKPEEVSKAPIVQSIDNALLREMAMDQEVDTASLHAYLFGRGFLKFGYDSEWGYSPDLDMGGKLQLGLTLTQLNSKGTRRIEYDSTISPGSPWCQAVMPHDIVVPWGTRDVYSAPWIAHRVVRRVDDLKADRKYTVPRDVKGQLSMEDFLNSYRNTQSRQTGRSSVKRTAARTIAQDYIELWEIHDRCTGRIYVVTWDCDKFLRNEPNALQIENGLPFASIGFTPRSRSIWVTPDAYYLYYIQAELSDTAVQRTKQRRISSLKFLYDSGVISEAELQKLMSPDVGVCAEIETGGDITKAIQMLNFQPNPSLAQEEELLRANAREQLGMSRNQLGEFVGGRKTATEASTVDRASKLRMSRRGLQVKRLYEDGIRIVNNIIFTYWTLPRYVSVIGQQNAQKWMAVNGPQLKGRYAYNVEFIDEEELQRRKLAALQLYSQLIQDPAVDPIGLREFLTSQVNDPAFERIFSADVRRRMLELQVLNGNLQQGSGQSRGGAPGGGVPGLQLPNGQVPNPPQDASRLLAGGRNGAGAYR